MTKKEAIVRATVGLLAIIGGGVCLTFGLKQAAPELAWTIGAFMFFTFAHNADKH